jgi:hypothetical protein
MGWCIKTRLHAFAGALEYGMIGGNEAPISAKAVLTE